MHKARSHTPLSFFHMVEPIVQELSIAGIAYMQLRRVLGSPSKWTAHDHFDVCAQREKAQTYANQLCALINVQLPPHWDIETTLKVTTSGLSWASTQKGHKGLHQVSFDLHSLMRFMGTVFSLTHFHAKPCKQTRYHFGVADTNTRIFTGHAIGEGKSPFDAYAAWHVTQRKTLHRPKYASVDLQKTLLDTFLERIKTLQTHLETFLVSTDAPQYWQTLFPHPKTIEAFDRLVHHTCHDQTPTEMETVRAEAQRLQKLAKILPVVHTARVPWTFTYTPKASLGTYTLTVQEAFLLTNLINTVQLCHPTRGPASLLQATAFAKTGIKSPKHTRQVAAISDSVEALQAWSVHHSVVFSLNRPSFDR